MIKDKKRLSLIPTTGLQRHPEHRDFNKKTQKIKQKDPRCHSHKNYAKYKNFSHSFVLDF